eukprot:TRINITY_DN1396_c0_g1_i1.p1 TRINITY_DN1396_c0_g1~~TRINITY_DN1396_c0_g1_i1.p1  ORF type:complete len:170 (-),score=47.16 TRINITY_DN1396_c0_g1_i1:155-595(-)
MRIVVALDGGESTKAVFERACTLVQRGRDVLVLLSVAEHAFPSYGEGYQQALMQANKRADARAREIVQCYAKKAAALNISAEECTPSGDPRLAIVEEAERIGADMLVIGRRNLSGIERAVVGSTSAFCMRELSCAVLIVKGARSES